MNCMSCGSSGEIHRHHIHEDLYFVRRGYGTKEDYFKFQHCARLCKDCHKKVTWFNLRFRKKYWKRLGAWARRDRTDAMYRELHRLIGGTLWQHFLNNRFSTKSDCHKAAARLAIELVEFKGHRVRAKRAGSL